MNFSGVQEIAGLFDVLQRRFPEVTFVIAIEVRRIFIPNSKPCLRRVELLAYH